jgi:hypothetical protein
MRGIGQRVIVGLAVGVVAQAVGAAPAAKQPTFECEMVVRTSTHGVVDRSKLTTKGNLVRLQKRTGAGLKILFIRNRQGTYHLNMHTNDGAKWPASWAQDAERRFRLLTGGPQGDPQAFLKMVKARRTGREQVGNRSTEVWTYSLPTTMSRPQVVRVFLDVKGKRPVKTEMRMPIAAGRVDTVTIEYPSYRWDFPLPDSFFDLPRNAKVVDLKDVDKGTSGIPGAPKSDKMPASAKG